MILEPDGLLNNLERASAEAPIPGAVWYIARESGAGLSYTFPVGALVGASHLCADMLLDGNRLSVFSLTMQEGEDGPVFRMNFGLLNQCSARMRAPLNAVNQNVWRYPREGAWLKPMCGGDRVDLAKVDRMRLVVLRKGPDPTRFCLTAVSAVCPEQLPPKLHAPVLPQGALLDEMGQSTLHRWDGKSRDADEVAQRLDRQREEAAAYKLPGDMNRWGGWKQKKWEGSGFFRTHHDGARWWLVDPEGHAFWSSGLDCVRFNIDTAYAGLEDALAWIPEQEGPYADIYRPGHEKVIDYLRANFIRAFGPEEARARWAEIALSQLRAFGFNTVANWSDWEIARGQVPYVRPLGDRALKALPAVYRDFPDVFHPDFERAVEDYASQLQQTVDDPAFIGYFLMNEPTWGFAQETPAAGMLFNTVTCYSRNRLAEFLQARYGSDAALSGAWTMSASLAAIAEGASHTALSPAAQKDLAEFSEVMVTRYFNTLSAACRAVDPHHLNLGIRYYTVPPDWAVEGMRSFDVFSMNCYKPRLLSDEMARISALLDMPIMVGEWHFGALDVGLPASGIGHVPDQASRGQAFRVYLEDAAAKPWCVGVHYFTLYDQSALGRFDGENYNIGFVDTCSRSYPPLAGAARTSHERLYRVAGGQLVAYNDVPVYLPLLFL
ncbi:MAG: hypothetical protein P1S60_03665 [Anaerolineae bacterium]|nr:hypothetical protein [Anaerolineae bacterium]